MDKESHNNNNNHHGNGNSNNIVRDRSGGGESGPGSLLLRGGSDGVRHSTTPDLGLQWGNRKRLRCMKVQVKHDSTSSNPVQRTTTVRVDRRVVRTEKDSSNNNRPLPSFVTNNNNNSHNNNYNNNNINQSSGYLNLRQRPPSPQQLPPRVLRSSQISDKLVGDKLFIGFVWKWWIHVCHEILCGGQLYAMKATCPRGCLIQIKEELTASA